VRAVRDEAARTGLESLRGLRKTMNNYPNNHKIGVENGQMDKS
jgi:hypothetical protein